MFSNNTQTWESCLVKIRSLPNNLVNWRSFSNLSHSNNPTSVSLHNKAHQLVPPLNPPPIEETNLPCLRWVDLVVPHQHHLPVRLERLETSLWVRPVRTVKMSSVELKVVKAAKEVKAERPLAVRVMPAGTLLRLRKRRRQPN